MYESGHFAFIVRTPVFLTTCTCSVNTTQNIFDYNVAYYNYTVVHTYELLCLHKLPVRAVGMLAH